MALAHEERPCSLEDGLQKTDCRRRAATILISPYMLMDMLYPLDLRSR